MAPKNIDSKIDHLPKVEATSYENKHVKILFIITSLNKAGAELMMRRLISELNQSAYQIQVVALGNRGEVGDLLEADGIKVSYLYINDLKSLLVGFVRLFRLIREYRPQIVQTWMYHADFLGGLVAWLAGVKAIYWSIRNSTPSTGLKIKTRTITKLCSILSNYIPTKIISCSQKARDLHVEFGYKLEKFIIIPNGIEISTFFPDVQLRNKTRALFGYKADEIVIGHVARYHPQKNHIGLLDAAREIVKKHPNVYFLLAGEGVTEANTDVVERIKEFGLEKKVQLIGPVKEVNLLMPGLDLLVSSSIYGEAFPNVLAEAMACGVVCVATNVGDAETIVGEFGWIVEPSNTKSMVAGIESFLASDQESKIRKSNAAVVRMKTLFDIKEVSKKFKQVYE